MYLKFVFHSFFILSFLLSSAFTVIADNTNTSLRTAIVSTPETRAEADLLTAELSSQPGLAILERDRIDTIIAEQKISAAGMSDRDGVRVGRLLKADLLILLKLEKRTGDKEFFRSRVVAVRPGFILQNISAPYPLKSPQQIISVIAQDIPRWNNKLSSQKATIISMPKLKSSFRLAGTQATEATIHALLAERLSAEPGIFVAERQDTAILLPETESGQSASTLETVIVDGLIEQSPDTNMPIHLKLMLRRKNGTSTPIEATGLSTNLVPIVDTAATHLIQAICGLVPAKRWNPQSESQYYANRAIWLNQTDSHEDAEIAADTAIYLGLDNPDIKKLKLKLGLLLFTQTAPGTLNNTRSSPPKSSFPRQWLERFYTYLLDIETYLRTSNKAYTSPPSLVGPDILNSNNTITNKNYFIQEIMKAGAPAMYNLFISFHNSHNLDSENQAAWDRVLQQYKVVRNLLEPRDPPGRILDRVANAYLWCQQPAEFADLFYQAYSTCKNAHTERPRFTANDLICDYYRYFPADQLSLAAPAVIGEYIWRNPVKGLYEEAKKRERGSNSDLDRIFWTTLAITTLPNKASAPEYKAMKVQLFEKRPATISSPSILDYLRKWEIILTLTMTTFYDETSDSGTVIQNLGNYLLKNADQIALIPSGIDHFKYFQEKMNPWSETRNNMSIFLITKLNDPIEEAKEAVANCRNMETHDKPDTCTRLFPVILDKMKSATNMSTKTALWLNVVQLRNLHPSLEQDKRYDPAQCRKIIEQSADPFGLSAATLEICLTRPKESRHYPGDFCDEMNSIFTDMMSRCTNKVILQNFNLNIQIIRQTHGLPMSPVTQTSTGNVSNQNSPLAVHRRWDVSTLAANKGTHSRVISSITSGGGNSIWCCITFMYGREEPGIIHSSGKKTYVVKVRLPDFASEVIPCPWLLDPYAGPTAFRLLSTEKHLLILAGDSDAQTYEKLGAIRLETSTGKWDIWPGFNPTADPGYHAGKIIQPVTLAYGGDTPNMAALSWASGIILIDVGTMKRELLVSGLRNPPQTPLDIPKTCYFIQHVEPNGDVFILNHNGKCTVYNFNTRKWRSSTQAESIYTEYSRIDHKNTAFSDITPAVISLPETLSIECALNSNAGLMLTLNNKQGLKYTIPLRLEPETTIRRSIMTTEGLIFGTGGNDTQMDAIYFLPANDIKDYLAQQFTKRVE
ncbi:MAG: hypothetical protein A2283_14205 [Lentisphaerae bacterium RIFOXYA12_FULL_48_11]|nr:MAG: hypothetical protein A2283_14205 [Lentisphaerae bacterium RIFOXYA12_FULL_48_11]